MATSSPFRVPPEVPRYFADKSLKPAFSWLDVWGQEHAHSFTVAKAVDAELLATFKASIQRAIDAGQGFETWRKDLRPELERLGWAKPRRVADPTGREPDRVVNFGAPGRLQTIFEANMRSARAAGQWERIQRSKGALPYLLYVRTTSARPRPQHLAWAGTILPADDPWWSTHFPPNGWRCKCAVRQISRFERDELLGEDGYSDERPPAVERTFVNRRSGEIAKVPDGIDPGWGHNPGLAASRERAAVDTLRQRLVEAVDAGVVPPQVRRIVSEVVNSPAFDRLHEDAVTKGAARRSAREKAVAAGGDKAAGNRAEAGAAPWSHANLPIAVMPQRAALWSRPGAAYEIVTVSDNAIGHSHADHPTAVEGWRLAQQILDKGQLLTSAEDPERLWGIRTVDGNPYVVVLARVGGGTRIMTMFKAHERYVKGLRKKRQELVGEE